MTRDKIIKTALDCGISFNDMSDDLTVTLDQIEEFYLAAFRAGQAEMREKAADVVDNEDTPDGWSNNHIAEKVRAIPLEGETE
jgi:hypothetical protein